MNAKDRRRLNPIAAANAWNDTVKVGDTVEFRPYEGAKTELLRTRTPAEVMGGHTAVVWLHDKPGCVGISFCKPVPAAPLTVDWLTSENCYTLLIEGHVDLIAAAAAIRAEGGEEFPAPRHTWMHDTEVPEGEDADWWRQECKEGDKGAQPVTMSMREH